MKSFFVTALFLLFTFTAGADDSIQSDVNALAAKAKAKVKASGEARVNAARKKAKMKASGSSSAGSNGKPGQPSIKDKAAQTRKDAQSTIEIQKAKIQQIPEIPEIPGE
jgi:hypothetical protein